MRRPWHLFLTLFVVLLAACRGPLGVQTQVGYLGQDVLQRNVGVTSLRLQVK